MWASRRAFGEAATKRVISGARSLWEASSIPNDALTCAGVAKNSSAEAVTGARPVPADVTVCLTSCGRLDLLRRTLESFGEFNPNGAIVISEDSADPAVRDSLVADYPDVKLLWEPERQGLMRDRGPSAIGREPSSARPRVSSSRKHTTTCSAS